MGEMQKKQKDVYIKGIHKGVYKSDQMRKVLGLKLTGKRVVVEVGFITGEVDHMPLFTCGVEWCFCDERGRVIELEKVLK